MRFPLRSATLLCVMLFLSSIAQAQSTQPAIPSRDEVVALMRKAADYQLAEQAKKRHDNGWIRAAFYTGVMAAHETTRDEKYLTAAREWAQRSNWGPAQNRAGPRFADNQACAQTYAELHFIEPDPKRLEPTRKMFDDQMATPKPGRVDWWWCDALYMAPPALARLAKATNEPKYLDFMDRTWWDATEFLYDKEEHLFFRDAKQFPPRATANGKKVFWSRGNGWVVAGTVRVLQFLPKDHPSRPRYLKLHQDMCAAIAKLQHEDGLWRPSLLDPEHFPMPETSGTAFFTYAMAWGINNGTLDRATYLPVVLKGWAGLASKVTPDGKLGSVQRVAAEPGAVKPEDTHEYAVGALLLAGSEIVKLAPEK